MRNPLYKRLPREFLHDVVKYIIILLFLAFPIALCSGYMIGNDSMIEAYYEGVEKYNLEDGHFKTLFELSDSNISAIESSQDIEIYKMLYKEETSGDHTVRVYNADDRKHINKWNIHKGNIPQNADEIALDRLYCENNKIKIGDKYIVSEKEYTVSATIALVDYSCLFKNNTDSMFDANKFTIAIVNYNAFNSISNENLKYNYSYLYNQELNDKEIHDKTQELAQNIYSYLNENSNMLDELLAKEDNQAITFAIDDLEGDLTMMLVFGLIVVFGIAFVFALSIKSEIEGESRSIGTLKALGYKNSELLAHYLILPTIMTILGAILGNILAYTFIKSYIVSLYYHSYSLPLYKTIYNPKALVITTLIPLLLVLLINVFVILKTLQIPCLNLLKNQLQKKKKAKTIKLSRKIKFIPRFQLRVIFQNRGTYLTLFFGTLFATIILLFGLMMNPLLDHFKDVVVDSEIAPYQTILKMDVDDLNGEKFYFKTLNYKNDEIIVYGLYNYGDSSEFLDELKIKNKQNVVISSDISEKYDLKKGKSITLSEKFSEDEYKFKIDGKYNVSGSLIVFMDQEYFKEMFDDYLTAYFSSEKLNISDEYVYKTITTEDLLLISNQLADSMGRVMYLFVAIAVILFVLLIFLLAKIVIEKNQNQISMLKIIGYKTTDINKIYNISTGIVTLVSVLVCTFISEFLIKLAWDFVLKYKMKGWLSFYVAPYLYPLILGIGLVSFLVVYAIESRRISKVDLTQTLKNENL